MLRTCSLNLSSAAIESGRYKTCLEYHIHKCAGPCVGLQSEEAYDATIKQVQQLLNGKTAELVALLRDEMNHQANSTRFEAAAAVRDRIAALEKYASRQKMVSSDPVDRDLFAVARDPDRDVACAVLFLVREGKIVGRSHKVVRRTRGRSENELLQSFVERHYTDAAFVPDEVFLSHDLVDAGPLEAFLRQEKGRKVPFHIPARGEKAGLMRMVQSNAALLLQEHLLERARQEEGNVAYAVRALHEDLRLPDLPRRIECFDISHLAGTGTVASCVVFVNGTAKKSEYRSFNIRSTAAGTPDDFQAMREVVSRRFRRISADGGPWPDLVVVDGGKGQLSSAVEALTELEIYGQFPLVGLAKRLEEVFFPGDSESKRIPRTSASLQLLQRIRNEAHRFAVMRQRSKRSRDTLRSELLEIPGIGEKTAKSLLRTFGSVAVIAELDRETLAGVVGPARAGRIRRHFERDSRSAGT
jgi:excinuclease ABC subunit C